MAFFDWYTFFWEQIIHIDRVLPGLFNIPWLFVALQPLRLLGPHLALIVVQIASFYIVMRLCFELQLPAWRVFMILLSGPFVFNVLLGQIDGLIIGAYLSTPALAALLALAKPQTALWAGLDAVRKRPKLIYLLIILLVSAYLLWNWPFSTSDPYNFVAFRGWIPPILLHGRNWSLFPVSLLLLIPFFRSQDRRVGMAITPFLFPYAGIQSLLGPVIAAAAVTPWWAFLGLWILLWVRALWMMGYIG